MKRLITIAALAIGLGAAACGVDRPDIIRNTGLSDRCADFLRLSYPGTEIQMVVNHVDVATTESGNLGLMIVDVQGVRPDIPATGGFLANQVAARCRFQNGVLTEFRWTKGPAR
jgi:hypothetical protein